MLRSLPIRAVARARAAAPVAAATLRRTFTTAMALRVTAAGRAAAAGGVGRAAATIAAARAVAAAGAMGTRVAARAVAAAPRTARGISSISLVPSGVPETLAWRMAFQRDGKALSPWHDIALFPECNSEERGIVNFVNEIPRGSTAKMEIATTEPHSPIKQDVKKGKLRYFTYGRIPFNYGALPQTWEDPSTRDPLTGFGGDNDPLDVVELSGFDAADPTQSPTAGALATGQVLAVKVLGIMALIDEGETDWKLLAIALTHPLAPKLWDVSDLNRLMPTAVPAVRHWFKHYKTTDGKAINQFALNEAAADKSEAMRVVRETHHSWADLVTGKAHNPKRLWLPAPLQAAQAINATPPPPPLKS